MRILPGRVGLTLTLCLLMLACSKQEQVHTELLPNKLLDYKSENAHYLVRLNDRLNADEKQEILDIALPLGAKLSWSLKNTASLDLTRVEPSQRLRVIEELISTNEGIQYIESDEVMKADSFLVDDPHFKKQWSHKVIGSKKAWELAAPSEDVIVAVIDGGIDINHPDLKANIWTNPQESRNGRNDDPMRNPFVDDVHGWDFANEDNDPSSDSVKDSHGTHVAGILGAVIGNGLGVAGHASNIKIMPLRYLVDGDGYTRDSLRAIRYAIDHGARIINLSSGSFKPKARTREILQEAEAAGVLVVAAAGNYSANIDRKPYYPASYGFSNVISVAATDSNDHLWSDSNYGEKNAHIAAPGVSIYSTVNQGYPVRSRSGGLTTVEYVSKWGTSMAAPVVSAVAAMIMGVRPELKAHEVREILFKSADQVSSLKGKVAGQRRLNAVRALELARTYEQ